jgi:hypothetical protein
MLELWTHKVTIFITWEFLGLPLGNYKKINNLDATSTTIHKIYYKEGSGSFSKGSKQC